MEQFIRILKKIFCLPPLPTVLIAFVGYALIIFVAALHINIMAIQYLAYIGSAYALVITITGFPYFRKFIKSAKRYMNEHPLMQKFRSTAIGKRFYSDVRFRTEISLYQGLFINLIYIGIKMFSGIRYRSLWFISLAIYYALLAVMRLLLLHQRKRKTDRNPMEIELYRYRMCGIMLLIMNQALAGIVIFMVHQKQGFEYPGMLIYLMALYSFYYIITAVINLVKFRKHGSPIMSAAKVINLVAAMVSILSLETAMLAQFGGGDEEFRTMMTGATGSGVCTIVIGMAVFMIWKSTRQIKNLRKELPVMDEKKEAFNYTYSAAQQKEIKDIREKYTQPTQEEEKMERLRRLDRSVTKPGTIISLIVGIVSVLIMGTGMSCVMVWGEMLFIPGIIIGVIGMAGTAAAYPIYSHITKKQREKLAPEIIRLSDELTK